MKQVFPKEILENTSEVFLFKHSRASKWFLWILLSLMIFTISLLPIVKVDVYSSARGIIRAEMSKTNVNAITSANVLWTGLLENKRVCRGDTLLILDSQHLNEKLNSILYKIGLSENYIKDLRVLAGDELFSPKGLHSPKYQKMAITFSEERKAILLDIERLKRDLDRTDILFSKGVIAEQEHSRVSYDYELVLSKEKQAVMEFKRNCAYELLNEEDKIQDLIAKKKQLLQEKRNYVITASINGTLNKVAGISKSSFVFSGTKLAEISPEKGLLIECYVSPFDIGLIKKNMKTQFQIDAFNYNQWGIVTGSVVEIGHDLQVEGINSYFKVMCKMDRPSLRLKNGFKGVLKKGMTVNAHFMITRRTLLDLLYDQIDDWFVPSSNHLIVPGNIK